MVAEENINETKSIEVRTIVFFISLFNLITINIIPSLIKIKKIRSNKKIIRYINAKSKSPKFIFLVMLSEISAK